MRSFGPDYDYEIPDVGPRDEPAINYVYLYLNTLFNLYIADDEPHEIDIYDWFVKREEHKRREEDADVRYGLGEDC